MELECRYCLEEDTIDNLVSPCQCSGTSKYIHPACLNRWRYENIENEHFNICIDCKTPYKYTVNHKEVTFLNVGIFKLGYMVFYFMSMIINMFVFSYKHEVNSNNTNNKTDDIIAYETAKIFIITNITQAAILYIGYYVLFIFIHHKKEYAMKMYRLNLCIPLLFFQALFLKLHVFPFVIVGFIFLAVGFSLHYNYILKHNKTLAYLNRDNIVYEST